jgi:hypothetical protein
MFRTWFVWPVLPITALIRSLHAFHTGRREISTLGMTLAKPVPQALGTSQPHPAHSAPRIGPAPLLTGSAAGNPEPVASQPAGQKPRSFTSAKATPMSPEGLPMAASGIWTSMV